MLPKISIVTPSFNQGRYLPDALRSVHASRYPHREHVVVDGGSTDGSVDLLHRHADQLAWWVSEKDNGQYDAINKGFAHTTGEVMAWLNADDQYMPWALEVVGEIFAAHPRVEWLTTFCPITLDAAGRATRCTAKRFGRAAFRRGAHLPGSGWRGAQFIQQESTFWRRSLWERAGAHVDASLRYAGDFDLWARFALHAELYGVETPLGGFRYHGEQKTSQAYDTYLAEARTAFVRHGYRLPWKGEAMVRSLLVECTPSRVRRRFGGLFAPFHVCRQRLPNGPWELERL